MAEMECVVLGATTPRVPELRQDDVFDGVVGDHVVRCRFIDLEAERAGAGSGERILHLPFVAAHGLRVGQAGGLFVVLRLSEAAVIPPH
jgi:hypothetical protein